MAKKTTRRSSKAKTAKAATKTTNQVLVVNMIPKSLSGETHQDSEPTIAVNPANPTSLSLSSISEP